MKNLLKIIIAFSLVIIFLIPLVSCSDSGKTTANQTQAATTSTPAAKAIVLRLAIPSPKGDPIVNNAENFANDFNKQAGGKYVIEIHPGESLIKFPDSLDALRTGAVEIDLWPIGAFSGVDPNLAAAEMPFLVNSIEADAAIQAKIMPLYDTVMAKKFNIKPLYTHTCLGIDMISVKSVKTRSDWKGMLVQSVSPQTAQFIELMGGASVPIPFSDAYQSLQKKIIEGTMQSASMVISFKLHEVASYVLRGYLTPSAVVVAINNDVYNKMPKDIQDILAKSSQKAQTDTNNYFVDIYHQNYKTMAGLGMTIYDLPKDERDGWVKVLQPYCDQLYSKMDPNFASQLKTIGSQLDKDYPYTVIK
jgi:TRAP-type C4-dicarboxylate transport system substrate-binding protein